MNGGWRQPAVIRPRAQQQCVHLGLIVAVFGLAVHPVGHEWVCVCGKVFVVVSGDDGKRLVPEWRKP